MLLGWQREKLEVGLMAVKINTGYCFSHLDEFEELKKEVRRRNKMVRKNGR